MIKAVLLDFDGTLVTNDMLSVVAGIVGKEEESNRINQEFWAGKGKGVEGLIARINLLQGVSVSQIESKINENLFLMPGAKELLAYLQAKSILTIIASGSITPITQYYAKLLGVMEVVGPSPVLRDGTIIGITTEDFPQGNFKLAGIERIIKHHQIDPSECLAIGDSPSDIPMFEYAGYAIAINPKNGVEKYANTIISDSLLEAIPILEKLFTA